MSRALAVFMAYAHPVRVRVRVLATQRQVQDEMKKSGVRKYRDTRAFFAPAGLRAGFIGTIVLPLDDNLEELVPHESFHAVMEQFVSIDVACDEGAATACGKLSAEIMRQLDKRGLRP